MWENRPTTEPGKLVTEYLTKRIDQWMTSKGIYPYPMIGMTAGGIDCTKVKGMPAKCFETFFRACAHPAVQAAIFGFDRRTEPEMQLETDSVLTCILYEKTSNAIALIQARDCFRFGIVPYQFQPRNVQQMDWNNPFWIKQMREEMEDYIPNVIVGKTGTIHLPSLERIH